MDIKNVPEKLLKKNGAPNGKKVILNWTLETSDAFDKLIDAMCSDMVLKLPNFELDFQLTSDASDLGYGAVLEQEFEGKDRSIGFYSKCYTKAQKNYSTSEKELLSIVMAVENWSIFLYGRKFIVYSDHKPLAWLLNKKDPHPRLERWIIRLAVYEFEIRYKPGKENIVADMLSRLFDENDVNNNPEDEYFDIIIAAVEERPESTQETGHSDEYQYLEEIAMLPISAQNNDKTRLDQEEDEEISWIKNMILQNCDNKPKLDRFETPEQRVLYKEYNSLRVIDGIVYRQTEDKHGMNQVQLVLPKQKVIEVLDKIHKLVYSGHLGRRKTYRIMAERFYRPFLGKQVEQYVRECDTCQKIKSIGQSKKASLMPIVPKRTNEYVATDLAGPFPRTVRGNRYIQVMTCLLSKYLVCRALTSKETMAIANNLLEHWFWIFGIPEKLLSARGKEFRSRLMEAICSLLDIERLNTTPGHPECDGQSEKAVQQMKKMIRAHVAEDQENWDLGLSQLCFVYNTSVHETTGLTPFEVMYGRDATLPIDLLFPSRPEVIREKITENKVVPVAEIGNTNLGLNEKITQVEILRDVELDRPSPEIEQYIQEKIRHIQKSMDILARNRTKKMSAAKKLYDRKIKKTEYNIGDSVLVSHPNLRKGLARGLAPKYYGPFLIVGKNSNGCDYLIKDELRKKARPKQIHINNLKKYFHRGQEGQIIEFKPVSQEIEIAPSQMQKKSNARKGKKRTQKSQREENESTTSSDRDNSPVRIDEFEESSKESEPEAPTREALVWKPQINETNNKLKTAQRRVKSKKMPESTGPTVTRSGRVSRPVAKKGAN